jgi:hypothetical protein
LFPPASLKMPEAVAEYASHRSAADRWALGRFVVPLSRFSELQSAVAALGGAGRWPVSVLASSGDVDHVATIVDDARLDVQCVECKVASPAEVTDVARFAALGLEVYVETATLALFGGIAPVLSRSNLAGKIRTGGVTSGAFPSPREVLEFLEACRTVGIRFKATAGLHHAVRGEYRLTYEPTPPMGEMFGFLNVAMAAALLWHGRNATTVLQVLEERSIEAFEFGDDGIAWRDEKLTPPEVEEARTHFFAGFGSCSFREPMADLGLEVGPA